ncbi:caspase, EACC1-associated type [Sphaerothrix gracilis]|uniref:caspase, EACC1-associated type n=1 Tax=Sphaerothrix gracilis TaxID=3151835 RepID=UPI0031FE0015
MAKIALLIGVSEYGEGLTNLPGTQADIQAMQRVLESPDIGGFDAVELLSNPNRTQMERAIEGLFSENRSRDDLILLYFSGHGVRDESGLLYFANCITEKNAQGRILTSTAVSSVALQHYMSQSRSKRQVLILDCCFSGAFANDMRAKSDEEIDVKAQLGAEGRAVLTSSTATQVSYEKEGASIYTHYLVEGLKTGAADRNEDGQVTVDELHEYAREKLQEAAPTMQPEIYAVREGYKILLARAPQGDPKLVFRKAVNERAKLKRGRFSPIDERAFRFRSHELGLSAQEAEKIIQEVLQPYDIFWEKLDEFEQAVKETLEYDPQLSESSVDDLQYFQRVLKLRDEDIAPVLKIYQIHLTSDSKKQEPDVAQALKQAEPAAKQVTETSSQAPEEISLKSEKDIDYSKLRDLLKAQDWKAADQEAADQMLKAMGKDGWLDVEKDDLLAFPCQDLKTIDCLWTHYSKGKFGFSVQKKIYVDCGGNLDGEYPDDKIWKEFCDRVGWRMNRLHVSYSNVTFNTSAKEGHLPVLGFEVWFGSFVCFMSFWSFSLLASRLVNSSK